MEVARGPRLGRDRASECDASARDGSTAHIRCAGFGCLHFECCRHSLAPCVHSMGRDVCGLLTMLGHEPLRPLLWRDWVASVWPYLVGYPTGLPLALTHVCGTDTPLRSYLRSDAYKRVGAYGSVLIRPPGEARGGDRVAGVSLTACKHLTPGERVHSSRAIHLHHISLSDRYSRPC